MGITRIPIVVIGFLALAATNSVAQGQSLVESNSSSKQTAKPTWGHLTGRIIVTGKRPSILDEVIPEDQATCLEGRTGIKDDNVRLGPKGGLADVFVYLVPSKNQIKGQASLPIHPSYADRAKSNVQVECMDCRFIPHALVLTTNQNLVVKNRDYIGHRCQIITISNEIRLNVPKLCEYEVQLDRSDSVPGKITCPVRRWMDARILVRDNPYATVTRADGTFEIKNIPSGQWQFVFWHSTLGYMKELEHPSLVFGRRGNTNVAIVAHQTVELGTAKISSKVFAK